MDERQDSSSDDPLYSPRMEADPLDSLNNACLLNDSDYLFEEPGLSHDFSSTCVPETPSPLIHRRKRHSQKDEDKTVATSSCSYGRKWERPDLIPGYLNTTPSSQRIMKRRKLENLNTTHSTVTPQTNGFVPASSLLPTNFTWLESPRPLASSASSKPSSSAGSATCALDQTADLTSLNELLETGRASMQKTINSREQRRKKTRTKASKSSSAHSTAPTIEDEALLLDSAKRMHGPASSPSFLIPDDVVIIEDDAADDVMVVRSVQMAEDEAYARSLQEQFDMEERIEQQQRQSSINNHNHNHVVDSYVGLGWIPPWASMISSSSFTHTPSELSELQQVIFGEQPHRQQGRRQTGRTRASRRRPAAHLQMDLFNDSQGNNYEALLAFEEQQGAVMAKNTLSKAEIERLPIKTYDPTHSAGKTDCQICFSEYKAGERLRMLPCLHDYHVKCIDRWLKENATCPICRADVSESGGFS